MSRLRESTVQEKALRFLKNHYQEKYKSETIFARKEVRTTKKRKAKRADGFLCFNSSSQLKHTVSLEAKSHRTLSSLITMWNDERIGILGILLSLVIAFVLLRFLPDWPWYWLTFSVILITLISFFLFIAASLLFEWDQLKSIDVVRQANLYPANEKWIAISKSSYNLLEKKTVEFRKGNSNSNFRQLCKRNNIGVLLISRQKIEILEKPGYTPGYFLDCYAIKSEVQHNIENALQ